MREGDKLTPDMVFKDPYFLDFLGLKDTYTEKDVEAAILREMEAFILELGVGFAFVERQKRMQMRKTRIRGDSLSDFGIVLHRAGAERIEIGIDAEIPAR